ncbi:hypothetical protein, partial [Aeromonas veronii]
IWQREQQALAQMPQGIKGLAQDHIPLLATNLVGVDSLR